MFCLFAEFCFEVPRTLCFAVYHGTATAIGPLNDTNSTEEGRTIEKFALRMGPI
jgi:hypothetical protein